jgi:asparagine synthase (glutamine-hydrolysing)
MCGFFGGFQSSLKKKIKKESIVRLLKHRGPDRSKEFFFKTNEINFYTNFFRLAIIDKNKRSDQPYEFKNLVLVFNGEIYNYLEIKKFLKKKYKIKFDTEGDAEVLIKFIYYQGFSNISMLEGMWSFIIFDKIKKKIFLCRDRFGEKPLFYSRIKEGLFFCSEIKPLATLLKVNLLNINYLVKYLFCDYRYLFSDNKTFYDNIFSVNPGTILEFDENFNFTEHFYFNSAKKIRPRKCSRNKIIKDLKKILINSLKKGMRSDVKLAFCLSGGVDSTGLVSIAKKVLKKKIKTFTIFCNDKKYNEFDIVKKTIKKLKIKNHKWVYLKKENALRNLKKILVHRATPLPTLTSYIQWNLMQNISKDGYKVVISGNGSDEIFSGYYDHYLAYFYDIRKKKKILKKEILLWRKKILPLIRNKNFRQENYFAINKKPKYLFNFNIKLYKEIFKIKNIKIEFLERKFTHSILRNRMKNELFRESVPVILHEEDSNAMFHSIENRSPYLNTKIYDYMQSVDVKHLIHNGRTKSLLRDSLIGISPNHANMSYEKVGFNIDINEMIDFKSKLIKNYLLNKSEIFKLIDKKKIKNILLNKELINNNIIFLFKFLNIKLLIDNIKVNLH